MVSSRIARGNKSAIFLMLVSGFSGLGYQIVWTQQAGIWLGHDMLSVLAVVAAFFGGLAAGAFVLGDRIAASAQPVRWYVACELLAAAWGLALRWLMAPAGAAWVRWLGTSSTPAWQAVAHFAVLFLFLLPATFAMGATLPAMERVLAAPRVRGYAVALLYAANTGGAILSVLATTFFLIPRLGLRDTALVCVAGNLLCAALACRLVPPPHPIAPAPADAAAGHRTVALLFLAGLLGIGHEVLAVRVLSQLTENTVYTFSLALAVYLAGTGIGAALYQARCAASPSPVRDRDRFSLAVCVAILASVPVLAWSPSWLHGSAGAGMSGALLRETALCAAAFLLPSIAMGLLFSRLCVDARDAGISLGTALGANTIGAALAPPLFGIVLLPAAGPLAALSAVAAAYLCLSGVRGARQAPRWVALLAGVALAAGPVSLRIADVPPGGRLLSHRDGILGTVSVVEDADGVRRLHINNRQQEGSNVTGLVDGRLAYLPLMLHPAPASMLFLGMGTGVTARAAAREDGLDVDVVELLPEVVDASAYFANGAALPRNLHVHVADARRYVRTAGRQYDVIVADLFHPARSGTAALYTVEHYRAVRSRLAPDGVFCQWIALHQMDLETLRGIVRAFLDVYPQGYAMLASNSLETPVIGLVARANAGPAPAPWRLAAARTRLEGARDGSRLQALQLYDEYALLGSFVAGPAALGAFSRGAPPNTDDRQTVAYGAPRATYAPQTAPRARLLAFMRQAAISPDELAPMAAPEGPDRLRAYLDGRARFLELGARVRPGADVHAMLDQVEEPLLAIAAGSPEFRPAYDPLIAMAQALCEAEPQAGRHLLERIRAAQPGRPEAAELLRRMSP